MSFTSRTDPEDDDSWSSCFIVLSHRWYYVFIAKNKTPRVTNRFSLSHPILSSPSIPIHFIIRCLCVLFLIHQSIDIVCGAFEWEVGDENK